MASLGGDGRSTMLAEWALGDESGSSHVKIENRYTHGASEDIALPLLSTEGPVGYYQHSIPALGSQVILAALVFSRQRHVRIDE